MAGLKELRWENDIEGIRCPLRGKNMSMQEGGIERTVVPYGDTAYLRRYEKTFLEVGKRILVDAQAWNVLVDHAMAVKHEAPDMQIDDIDAVRPMLRMGVVSIAVKWGFEDAQGDRTGGVSHRSWNMMTLMARVVTGEIVVAGNEGQEVLKRSEWETPGKLMEAVRHGYDKPLRWFE